MRRSVAKSVFDEEMFGNVNAVKQTDGSDAPNGLSSKGKTQPRPTAVSAADVEK